MNKGWLLLFLAIGLEISGTTSMKLAQGFTRLTPSVLVFVFYASSLTCLTLALKTIDVSITYAVWSGIGTAVVTTIGVAYFKEPMTLVRFVCIAMIIAGVVGLYLVSSKPTTLINPTTTQP